MTIKELYKKYEIPPNLQKHQLRVAGVAYLISENWKRKGEVKTDLVTRAGLLHDMGNIVKFEIEPGLKHKYGLENLDYWKEVQERFIDEYGEDALEVTGKICKEIGQEEVYELVKREYELYLKNPQELEKSKEWEVKIFYYADFRVKPEGVVSLEERIDDLVKRYEVEREKLGPVEKVEGQLQKNSTIDIAGIEEKDVQKLFENFLSVKI